MDVTALGLAALGAFIVLAGFYLAGKVTKKLWKSLVQVFSLLLGFIALAAFPVPVETAASAGTYWLIILVVCAVVSKIFFKKKEDVSERA
ncbi:MAG: hypothetical protein P1U59_10115 [Alcanivorax sp.]|jgi:uncharacterized membrane protein YoaK (UPF0700 family)|uniref:hypothetical protein n=1 Tax=Alcanivorax TaxID=59753 RepID=UPI001992DF68|nr:hypothetical protein [Alcanivorax sp.]MBD3645017.1 hypothetical protein [Alcanivorax sp.]MDF1724870.1 hypothetical protein [Alcanivorax sp.]